MNQNHDSIIDQYLEQLSNGGDFTDIPMTPTLSFTGPLSEAETADQYRQLCTKFAAQVKGLTMRTRASNQDTTHLTYDIDLGLPDGPIPTAQIIGFNNDAISNVEVIFDAIHITGAQQ